MESMRVPEHVAIILDGNGRWAKKIPSQEYGACTGQQDGGENH